MKKNARLYQCVGCYSQVLICSDCDRGNVYCSKQCSQAARSASQRRANQKYQSSRKGRFTNAARQRRHRQRMREKVTDQGSRMHKANDLLAAPSKVKLKPLSKEDLATHCHFCGCACDLFLRIGFMRQRLVDP